MTTEEKARKWAGLTVRNWGEANAEVSLEGHLAKAVLPLLRVVEAAKLSATRLEILTGRMRACHAETGKHELLPEAEAFCAEARAALAALPEELR